MTTEQGVFAHIERDRRLRAVVKMVEVETAVKDALRELDLWPDSQLRSIEDVTARNLLAGILEQTDTIIGELAKAEARHDPGSE